MVAAAEQGTAAKSRHLLVAAAVPEQGVAAEGAQKVAAAAAGAGAVATNFEYRSMAAVHFFVA